MFSDCSTGFGTQGLQVLIECLGHISCSVPSTRCVPRSDQIHHSTSWLKSVNQCVTDRLVAISNLPAQCKMTTIHFQAIFIMKEIKSY